VLRRTSPTANGGFIGFQGALTLENTSYEASFNNVEVGNNTLNGEIEISTDFSADILFLAGVNTTDALSFYGGIGLSAISAEISLSDVEGDTLDSGSDSNFHFGPKAVLGVNYQLSEGRKVFAQLEHARYREEDYFFIVPLEFDQTKFGVGMLFAF